MVSIKCCVAVDLEHAISNLRIHQIPDDAIRTFSNCCAVHLSRRMYDTLLLSQLLTPPFPFFCCSFSGA